MSQNRLKFTFLGILVGIVISACSMLPTSFVWLKSVDFEVDPQANRGASFVCHITIAYSQDLLDKLKGMPDSKVYFEQVNALQKTYKDSIQIFKFDMIPGRNQLNRAINLRSYTRAKGGFIFAKYTTPGKFIENVGISRKLTVRFLPNSMEVHSDMNLERLTSQLGRN